ncbi:MULTISPECIES: hypothetical protein [Bacillus]|uniref:Uncharacterized protein n=1 Tax=Bacillus cereus TaxID=1396 RepID=A0A9X6GE21_BACCE|nr:hypothetical protein [Bacillus cereus]OOR72482.1 hypothetical protein BLX06_24560 [Bacillus cereus]
MNKSYVSDSTHLLQEIDRKMSIIGSTLQQISESLITKEVYTIHYMLLEVSKSLLTLQQDPKMTTLAKELSLQLQDIQEQYKQLFAKKEKYP